MNVPIFNKEYISELSGLSVDISNIIAEYFDDDCKFDCVQCLFKKYGPTHMYFVSRRLTENKEESVATSFVEGLFDTVLHNTMKNYKNP